MTVASTVLITSAGYVSAELAAEFGLVPPAFLPIGNRRLYWWQVEEIRRALPRATITMSVPADFQIDEADTEALAGLGVQVVDTPVGLTLGESLTYVILSANLLTAPLCILHGDTLLQDYDFGQLDAVSAGVTRTYYPWADFQEEDGQLSFGRAAPDAVERHVLTGAFHLADIPLFLRCLAQTRNAFIDSLARYSQDRPLATSTAGRWSDFGHLHTYFQSRRQVTTERHFNQLKAEAYFFVKSSSNVAKIEAERAWFRDLPDDLRIFTPDVTDGPSSTPASACYRIEYCHLTTLNDLFVFGRLPVSVWRSIFDACSSFLEAAGAHSSPGADPTGARALFLDKTLERIDQFAHDRGVDPDVEWTLDNRRTPSMRRIAAELSETIGPTPEGMSAIVHGDFCFSNIFFDFRTQRVKLIDPRGLDPVGRRSLFGDVRYETGKLHHSVVGLYDYIVAGQFKVRRPGTYALELQLPISPNVEAVQRLFEKTRFGGRSLQATSADAVSVLLFLSMLPLHADDESRQWAMLANAFRLYQRIERGAAP
jgi:hypothetical protein